MATVQTATTERALSASQAEESYQLYQEGMIAGVIGAATLAVWFLIIDAINGQPFYTPTVLGTALFKGGAGLASRLLGLADHNPNIGFGILLLFVVFEFGFVAISAVVAEGVLRALAWQAVVIGNLLAAAAMSYYFWRRHPNLTVNP